MVQYDYVIWDVDGTLLDTTEGLVSAVEYAVAEKGLRPLNREELLTFIGPPVQESFRRYYDMTDEEVQEVTTVFRNRYAGEDLLKAVVYEGLHEVCERLHSAGVKMAVATFKREDYARRIVEYFGFGKYCHGIFGADHFNQLTKADIIMLARESLGAKQEDQVLMIGDSAYDAIGAAKLGMDFLGVTYGFGFQTKEDVQEHPAIGCASSPCEIVNYIINS